MAVSSSICSGLRSPLIGSGQLVAGQLLVHELIERLVGVERANHVVAILEGPGADRVLRCAAFAVGVAGHVEPMPGPAFAVVRRREQPIDQFFVGVGATGRPRTASTSSGVGGKPSRSKYARRMSLRLSASGENESPAGIDARSSASIGVRTRGSVA